MTVKERGNEFFKKQEYKKALDQYNIAISLDDTVSIFHSNKARCLKLLKKWGEGIDAAIKALALDPKNVKAQVIYGECLINLGREKKKVLTV